MRILGGLMIALPFILLAAYVLIQEGLTGFIVIFGGTALIMACVAGGVYLVTR